MKSHSFLEQLSQSLSKGLPGEASHFDLMPINRPFSSDALKRATDYRKSAVGVVLFEKANSIHCILIQRPKYEGTHSNQVSFPGGKMDSTDPDLEFTARRECWEEIAMPDDRMHLISPLSEIYIPVSKFLVQPFLFFVEDIPDLKADEREVEEIFTFNIQDLLNDEIIQFKDITIGKGYVQKNVPYFNIEDRVVWGATAMILSEFKAVIKSF